MCASAREQGQEAPAEAVLDKYMKEGGWVFLDNVHLMQGWIPTLERKLEAAAENAHADFRCFFSAEPINGAPQVHMPCCTCSRGLRDRPFEHALHFLC
jgi:dynein heavy chain